jgi:tRNA 2-thiouridine synthesizing protein A
MRNAPTRLEVSAHLVDARGKACPAPIIELARALRAHERVELWADDPAARGDLEAFAASTGHRLAVVRAAPSLQALVERRP